MLADKTQAMRQVLADVNYYGDLLQLKKDWSTYISRHIDAPGPTRGLGGRWILTTFQDVVAAIGEVGLVRGLDTGPIRVRDLRYFDDCPNTGMLDGPPHQASRALARYVVATAHDGPRLLEVMRREIRWCLRSGGMDATELGQQLVYRGMHRLLLDSSLADSEVACHLYFKNRLTRLAATLPAGLSPLVARLPAHRRYRQAKDHLATRYLGRPDFQDMATSAGLAPERAFAELFNFCTIAVTGLEFLVPSTLGVLNNEPELRRRLVVELQALPDPTAIYDPASAPTLHAFILETARLYPPVDFMPRIAGQHMTLECKGQQVALAPGDGVLLSIFGANRDPERFARPDVFDLDRDFGDAIGWGGAGASRECPGFRFSLDFLKAALYVFLHDYRFVPQPLLTWETETYSGFVPRSFQVRAKEREPPRQASDQRGRM